jgi:hypothetical protein
VSETWGPPATASIKKQVAAIMEVVDILLNILTH